MSLELPAVIDGRLITLKSVKHFLAWMQERGFFHGEREEVIKACASDLGIAAAQADALITFCLREGLISFSDTSDASVDGRTEVEPHHISDADVSAVCGTAKCTRCGVGWPCRSVVLGRDVDAAQADESDWGQLGEVVRARAELAELGWVIDAGWRVPAPGGSSAIPFRVAPGIDVEGLS